MSESAFLEVRDAFESVGLSIPSVSATFNAIGIDAGRRAAETRMAGALIRRAGLLGADVVTLCTGTRDPDDMWRAHPDNGSRSAWRELRATLDVLLEAAADGGVVLGIEPEPGNVVRDAEAAARLLGEVGSNAPIGIVFDPANLVTAEMVDRQERILAEAVETLGSRIVGVQAKAFGLVDFRLVFRLLAQAPAVPDVPSVPVIVQDVAEADARRVRRDLLRWYDEVGGAR